jgi:hypothetical protein
MNTASLEQVLEQEKYKLPPSVLFSHNTSLHKQVAEDKSSKNLSLQDVKEKALSVGFVEESRIFVTKNGKWDILKRMNYEMPHFPKGHTTIDSMLGIYTSWIDDANNFVLRTSNNQFSEDEFYGNLETLADSYMERSSFESEIMRNLLIGAAITGLVSGTIATIVSPYIIPDTPFFSIGFGVNMGLAGFMGCGISYLFSKRMSQDSKLPEGEIVGGVNYAKQILSHDAAHLSRVAFKKEVYEKLRNDGLDITPELFITKIYNGLGEFSEMMRRKHAFYKNFPNDFKAKYGENLIPVDEMAVISKRAYELYPKAPSFICPKN